MSVAAQQHVHRHFQRLNLNATAEWIDACTEWCRAEDPVVASDGARLAKACYDQWLSTDIRCDGVQRSDGGGRFPAAAADVTSSLLKVAVPAGFYTVQVNAAHDVGLSAYSQLQKLNRVKDENSLVSADVNTQNPLVASWEPKPNRMLKFALTNGAQSVEAVEHERLAAVPDPVPPGLKLTLVGPIVCRRGLLMLTPKNVKVLGGYVEEMQEEFSAAKQLAEKLSQQPPQQQRTSLPTQQYVPQGRPTQYRQGAVKKNVVTSRRTMATNKSLATVRASSARNVSDVFNDTDDELFASIDMPLAASSNQASSNVFDDDEDELFSQIELGTPTLARSKRGRFY
jgi:hypothetical protein